MQGRDMNDCQSTQKENKPYVPTSQSDFRVPS